MSDVIRAQNLLRNICKVLRSFLLSALTQLLWSILDGLRIIVHIVDHLNSVCVR